MTFVRVGAILSSNMNEIKSNNSLYLRIAIAVLALNFGLHGYVVYTLDRTQEMYNAMIQENLLSLQLSSQQKVK